MAFGGAGVPYEDARLLNFISTWNFISTEFHFNFTVSRPTSSTSSHFAMFTPAANAPSHTLQQESSAHALELASVAA
jgi:hypothetical protein